MLFGAKLASEVYPPWKSHYLSYDHLKKLLKESSDTWTEEDESRFVEALDAELEKVYSFESEKYSEVSDKLSAIEKRIEGPDSSKINTKDLEIELEEILESANQLDKFRRLNYTGFSKIVKKHDRLHPQYQVRPLLRVRLNALPFHSEDYSPLLYRLSGIYSFLSENFGTVSKSAKSAAIGSMNQNHLSGYTTLQFWVHPENLMEVKSKILRRLPVLVYNREEDDEISGDPTVTSLYMDNADFELYQSQLEKRRHDDLPTSLRFRWYGHLYEKPDIVLEQHNEDDGRITRINLKEKTINSFLDDNKSVVSKQVAKLKSKNAKPAVIEDYESAANELQSFISSHKIQPMLRTIYKRSAFEIPGDDRVRVILDSDILFIREDALSKDHPIRDPSSWHRTDLDQPNVNLQTTLRKGEYAKFPYSVLEVRLKHRADGNKLEKLPWVEELISSHLIKEVPHFSKFLQGIAMLYGEDDRLESLPFWLNDLDHDFRQDRKSIEAAPSSSSPSASPAATGLKKSAVRAPQRARYQYHDDEDDDDDDEDSDVYVEEENSSHGGEGSRPGPSEIGFPTWTNQGPKLQDMDSEDEEVDLPSGVVKPSTWIKNQSAVKVEAKVWLANERTFNKWLHVTCLLSALTFTLYSSVGRSSSPKTAELVAYILFALTIFSGLWGYTQYLKRVEAIKARGEAHLDNPIGPLIVAVGLLAALIINFAANYSSKVHA